MKILQKVRKNQKFGIKETRHHQDFVAEHRELAKMVSQFEFQKLQ
jgi:hypothetical protein